MIIAPKGYQHYLYSYGSTFITGYQLNDANDAIGYIFQLPKSGTIDRLGIYLSSKGGTPPDYNIGLVTLDADGHPTSTPYGGSASQTISPNSMSVGWYWITLSTPATAIAGDIVAVHVWPTASAPSSTNWAAFSWDTLFESALPRTERLAVSWSADAGVASSAFKYSDDTLVGFPVVAFIFDSIQSTTEWGIYLQLPFGIKTSSVVFNPYCTDIIDSEFDVVIYDGSDNILSSTSQDTGLLDFGFGRTYFRFEQITLSANTPYRIVLKMTNAVSIHPMGFQVDTADDVVDFIPAGITFQWTSRPDDVTAWTNSDVKIPWAGVLIDEIVAEEVAGEGGGDTGFVW
jgi:hypothetical protein